MDFKMHTLKTLIYHIFHGFVFLFLIFMPYACTYSKMHAGSGSAPDSGNEDKSVRLEKSLLFLISDGSSESLTQIIQCSDSTIKHGFAYVVFPFDHIENKDLLWQSSMEIDGESYPIEIRGLTIEDINTVNNIVLQLETIKNKDSYIARDDYQYIFYIDNNKVLTVSPVLLDLEDTPEEFKRILRDMFSLVTRLYPNYGFLNHID